MALDGVIDILLVAALGLALAGAARRVSLWRRGRPVPVNLIGGLLKAPRRYFRDLHDVVGRDKPTARMHVATAGGFVASMLLILLVHLGGVGGAALAWMLLAALALMSAGIVLEMARRYSGRLTRLTYSPRWQRLPVSLAAFAFVFIAATLPRAGLVPDAAWQGLAALVLGAVVALALAEMIVGMTWGGPMKHAFAGILHLAFHPRQDRFADGAGRSSDLKPADLEAPTLGVEKPADLDWNRLLGFDACVSCGRCEAMCPAHAAGQPLNPKALIQDMVTGFTLGHDRAVVANAVSADTLWACTTCRACVYECPMMIEHVDTVIDLRRHLTMERGETPGKGAEVLEDLRATDNASGADPAARADWASDLDLPLMADKRRAEVLFWVGEAAFDLRNQRTLRAFVALMKRAGVDAAILGTEEADCGDLARRLGDDALFQHLAGRNIATLARYDFDRIVTCDPHAFHVLANEYPALGGHYAVQHHTRFLEDLLQAGRLTVTGPLGGRVTYHDPCYLGRYNGEIDAPRAILARLGVAVAEMERSGMRSRCCGGGGGAPVTDIPGKRRIPDQRMDDARETDADTVAVACPQCTAMLEGVVMPRPEVRDIAELLLEGTAT